MFWKCSSCNFEICWSLFILWVPTGPQLIRAPQFLRGRMLYPSQVCKTWGKLMLVATNKCNQVTSERSQALTQNISQIKPCDTDKGHLPEINIWKQTPECSRLTLVTMIFTFTTSNICNNTALFYPYVWHTQGNLNYLNVNENVHIWHQDFAIHYLPEVLKDFYLPVSAGSEPCVLFTRHWSGPCAAPAWPFPGSCPHPIDYINPLVCSFFN